MLRQYRKFKRYYKKFNKKLLAFCPFLRTIKEIKKTVWNFKARHFGSVNENMLVFRSNNGRDCSGLPALVYNYMLNEKKYENYKFIWLFTNKKNFLNMNQNRNTRIYTNASKKGIRLLARAHYIVCDTELRDYEKLRPQQVLIFSPEEYYGIILNEGDTADFQDEKYLLQNVLHYADYIIAESSKHKQNLYSLCAEFKNPNVKILENFPCIREYIPKEDFPPIIPELPALFLDESVGSADGPLKQKIRRYPHFFSVLKKINQKAYGLKSLKRNITVSIKNTLKRIDIRLLKMYYTLTGFFRGIGLNPGHNARILHSYKNRYKGRRCFLIGNGPSLTVQDLELLKDEITFGCNRLYKLFTDTNWRPTYYCMIDALIAKYSSLELSENVDCPLFTNINTRDLMKYQPKHLIFARNLGEDQYRVNPCFEAYYVPSGATVMTFMLELAMYMGFTDIYLLGVDCTSSLSSSGHCAREYVNEELIQKDIDRIRRRLDDPTLTAEQVAAYYFDQSTYSYHILRKYADARGIHIYNATRGGKLEVYERRNLNEVIGKK